MPATSPEAIRRRTLARIAKREAKKAAKAEAEAAAAEVPPMRDHITDTDPFAISPPSGAQMGWDELNGDSSDAADPSPTSSDAAVPVTTPAPEPVHTATDPYREWLRTSQGQQLSHLRGVNMARLDYVYLDRLEAAFRAGFAAGVDMGI